MISERRMFETEDGNIFHTHQEAVKHEETCEFRKWYEENRLYGNMDGSYVLTNDLLNWIEDNAREIKKLLITMGL